MVVFWVSDQPACQEATMTATFNAYSLWIYQIAELLTGFNRQISTVLNIFGANMTKQRIHKAFSKAC
jgi:hypothetical protein